MLSELINQVRKKNYRRLIVEIPLDQLLMDLRIENVISDAEYKQLKNMDTDEERNRQFWEVIEKRGSDDDFIKFCRILQKNNVTTIKSIGFDLEKQATATSCSKKEASSIAIYIDIATKLNNLSRSTVTVVHCISLKQQAEHQQLQVEICAINPKNCTSEIKVLLLGDSGVGKTNLLSRFIHDNYKNGTRPTLGIDFSSQYIRIEGRTYQAQYWDTAGQEVHNSLSQIYFRGANGALLVYDITRRVTYEHVQNWLTELRTTVDHNIVTMLVGNKCDKESSRAVKTSVAKKFAEENNMLFTEASALNSTNVEIAFHTILREIFKNLKPTSDAPDKMNSIKLDHATTKADEKKSECWC